MLTAKFNETIAQLDPKRRKVALLAFWDFAAAFASVIHEWICMTLSARQFPSEIRKFTAALYWLNSALSALGDSSAFVLWYLSGVLQGCPGSAYAIKNFTCSFPS